MHNTAQLEHSRFENKKLKLEESRQRKLMYKFEQNRIKEEQKEKNKMARLEKLINKIKER